jgi:catechol 2,3-dioxygenase-like lactoylglutathione lyase family enzyme
MSLPSITGLDHYIIRVNDLEGATDDYRKLGFALALPGRHHTGTRNQTLILDANYLELLFVPPEQKAASRFHRFADSYEGPVAVALQTGDSGAVHADLQAVGVNAEPPVSGGRPVLLPEGAADAAWKNTQFPDGMPAVPSFFTCGHLTRELVYRAQWQDHPNGARRISALLAVHPDPAALQADYERLFGRISVALHGDRLEIRRGTLRLHILAPAAFSRLYAEVPVPPGLDDIWFAGSIIEVRDLAVTRQVLKDHERAWRTTETGDVVLPPAATRGTLIVFRQEALEI